MSFNSMTPDDLAHRVGRSGMRVRKLLRQMYPREAPGTGGRWLLTDDQVAAVLAYFSGGRSRPPVTIASGPPVTVTADLPTDWFWEGHVQAVMVDHLRRDGWTILSTADTATRGRGEDIAATKEGRQLVVEVKGYPSVGYRDPRRAGEIKRTNPTLQAKHCYADAVLKALRLAGTRSETEIALAFPDAPRYRSLIQETGGSLRQLMVGVYLIGPNGEVSELHSHKHDKSTLIQAASR
jgi:hypothetical protein